ncbi:unnamed protein product [Rotaria socialis]|uniref:Uncharacterized protein n=1 Tax=Rotaria socialis TaxID=392032 RepID=A0A821D8M7_9BILA|nr:unnamed protein product [Rotaria socialis]CAF3623379.1 unnamed protein product [Rotaria socialis]CAF4447151.1 unnamed protein product [Rotaria socialis]CAF4617810.1 unnamed protein product [Rotaria socialis]
MLSTFESLPDEIIMTIVKYCGDTCAILRTFLGLNQRLNRILIDKRLHLLTDFLHINVRDDYYNSQVFQQSYQQLLSLNTRIDEQELSLILQRLLSFHIQQKYIQLRHEFQLLQEKFELTRQSFTHSDITQLDNELKRTFDSFSQNQTSTNSIELIKSLVYTKGARCDCDDYELCRYNLTKIVNEHVLSLVNNLSYQSLISANSYFELFKALLISNSSLINNRDYVGNGGCKLAFFLVYTLYKLQYFYHGIYPGPVNMKCYRVLVDIFLLVIQCQKRIVDNEGSIRRTMLDILKMICQINNDISIQVIQWELLKIVIDEYVTIANEPLDEFLTYEFRDVFKNLFKNRRLDVLSHLYRDVQFEQFFNIGNYTREYLDIMTRSQDGRKLFYKMLDDNLLESIFSEKKLIFILLDKKERKLLEKLLKSSPHLIHQLDEDGNDPLLYICIKVYGCRHRIIQDLIKSGADLQRTNFKGQNFIDTLQLQKNRKLFKKLIEHEIISFDEQQINLVKNFDENS